MRSFDEGQVKRLVEFTQEQVSPSTRRIRGAGDVCMYLVEGTEKAALIDTGYGVGDLKGYIKTLTDKPLFVLITHGHVDHVAGAGQFEEVYMNHADIALAKEHSDVEMRKKSICHGDAKLYATLTQADFIPAFTGEFLPLQDGQTFDLGGVTLKMLALRGHTNGILTVLNVQDRTIMFGDACGVGVLLFLEESTNIEDYRANLLKMKQNEPLYDQVLREHGKFESPCSVLEDCIEACDHILAGTDDAMRSEFMGLVAYRAFAVDEKGKRLDGKEGNVLYTREKIHAGSKH